MRLANIASSGTAVPFKDIKADKELATELQGLLEHFGVLDPPVDGDFGGGSQWALDETLKALGIAGSVLDASVANALVAAGPDGPFPVKPTGDFAGQIVQHMASRKLWLCRHPKCLNVVYVEGVDTDGTPNDDRPDEFNDVRLLLQVDGTTHEPRIVGRWEATTEPGRHFTVNPVNPGGAARIALKQFKAWRVGFHKNDPNHEALIQVAIVEVVRDLNRDFQRAGDKPDPGLHGINQHHGSNQPKNRIGLASAGCLVGRTIEGHREFMKQVKEDPRFLRNRNYLFLASVLERKEFADVA